MQLYPKRYQLNSSAMNGQHHIRIHSHVVADFVGLALVRSIGGLVVINSTHRPEESRETRSDRPVSGRPTDRPGTQPPYTRSNYMFKSNR